MAKKEAAAPNVDVTPGNPLYITDENRTFGTVTVFLGGQIFVQTQAQINIDHLIKKNS